MVDFFTVKLCDYVRQLSARNPKKLSVVKLKILEALWKDDALVFPKPWVASSELLALTKQKYFDRRTRELRDQHGCDIESSYQTELNGYAWRIRSSDLKLAQNREYLSQQQKNKLFLENNHTCGVCGIRVGAGLRGLQADHRVPLSRGGTNELTNWQALCCDCNVGKRRACQDCTEDCQRCSWSFPDRAGVATMLQLSNTTLQCLDQYCGAHATDRRTVIENAIANYTKSCN